MKFRSAVLSTLPKLIKELGVILRDLSFEDNFTSFTVSEWTITANTEEKVRNELQVRPSKYLIVKQTGNALVTAGPTEWTDDFIYMKNHSATDDAVVTILFIK